ncbi:MAG: hypothetical protein IKP65_05690 [Alphaproteobacteria bacterium]|nr:hypothetical protein [Alphaproteobacteria bacterium]
MKKENKIAFKLSLNNVNTKEDFLEFLTISIKNIHFIFGNDNSITASNNDNVDDMFIDLKGKVNKWLQEEGHSKPFYPRIFIKKILNGSTMINYVNRIDNPEKMRPDDYSLDTAMNLKNFILSRIDKEDEKTGLKFKQNSIGIDKNNMPMDVYNAITKNFITSKNDKIYIKFSVNKELSDAYFNMNFVSIHKDKSNS